MAGTAPRLRSRSSGSNSRRRPDGPSSADCIWSPWPCRVDSALAADCRYNSRRFEFSSGVSSMIAMPQPDEQVLARRAWIVDDLRRLLPDERIIDSRSEEHPSELQSLMRNSYAAFCL